MDDKKVPVRITRSFLPYLEGEIAWFSALQAAALVKQGFAAPAPDVGPYVPAGGLDALKVGA